MTDITNAETILTLLMMPWDTSDLPPGVSVTTPSIKLVEAKQALATALMSKMPAKKKLKQPDVVISGVPMWSEGAWKWYRSGYSEALADVEKVLKDYFGIKS